MTFYRVCSIFAAALLGVSGVLCANLASFRIARPLQDKIARQPGPHAVEFPALVRAVQ